MFTSQTSSRPFFVTAAFCVRPVETSVIWVSLLGTGSLMGSPIPLPQQNTELRDGGLVLKASAESNTILLAESEK